MKCMNFLNKVLLVSLISLPLTSFESHAGWLPNFRLPEWTNYFSSKTAETSEAVVPASVSRLARLKNAGKNVLNYGRDAFKGAFNCSKNAVGKVAVNGLDLVKKYPKSSAIAAAATVAVPALGGLGYSYLRSDESKKNDKARLSKAWTTVKSVPSASWAVVKATPSVVWNSKLTPLTLGAAGLLLASKNYMPMARDMVANLIAKIAVSGPQLLSSTWASVKNNRLPWLGGGSALVAAGVTGANKANNWRKESSEKAVAAERKAKGELVKLIRQVTDNLNIATNFADKASARKVWQSVFPQQEIDNLLKQFEEKSEWAKVVRTEMEVNKNKRYDETLERLYNGLMQDLRQASTQVIQENMAQIDCTKDHIQDRLQKVLNALELIFT